jgi:hypothetical protein
MDYIYGHDVAVADFVRQLIPSCRARGFGNCRTIGIVDGGMLIAGLVYHNFDPDAGVIEISGAALPGEPWMTRETLKRMYQYPFLGCRCQMVINRVPAEDERQLYMLLRFGYSLIKVPRGLGRDKDLVIATLTREDWENNKFNRRLKHHLGAEPQQEAA